MGIVWGSMRVAGGVGVQEGSALLEEVVELALFVAGSALLVGKSSGRAGHFQEDVGDLVKRDLLAWSEFLLLVLHLLPS